MASAQGSELDKLHLLLEQAGLGKDLDLLAAILFVRNLVTRLSIYAEADKSRIQQFVLEEISKGELGEKTLLSIVEAIEAFLVRNDHTREIEDQLEREKRSTDALVDEMQSFFQSMRSSRDRQEQSLTSFNSATENAVKSASTRRDIIQQMRSLLTAFVSEFREEARQWEARARALERTAHFDVLLTDLYNRRSLDAYLSEIIVTSHSRGLPFSLCMIDVDLFKKVNDTFGHQVGDDVLRALAKIVRNTADQHDGYAARYGGEELVLTLPMPLDRAAAVAEQLRRDVEEYDFQYRQGGKLMDEVIHFTVSIGVAELRRDWDSDMLIRSADRALYLAKDSGRNLVGRDAGEGPGRIGWT